MASCNADIYTDGSSKGNPGPSGVGVVILVGSRAWDGKKRFEFSAPISFSTANYAELMAVSLALSSLKKLPCRGFKQVTISTDSSYVLKVLKEGSSLTRNRAVIDEIRSFSKRFPITFRKVKAHAGVVWNERADSLANLAAKRAGQSSAIRVSAKLIKLGWENLSDFFLKESFS